MIMVIGSDHDDYSEGFDPEWNLAGKNSTNSKFGSRTQVADEMKSSGIGVLRTETEYEDRWFNHLVFPAWTGEVEFSKINADIECNLIKMF